MAASEPCKVLVVDDNTDCAVSTALLLQAMGHYRVRAAHSADEAHHIAGELQPDVVVLDVSLPGKDGYDLGQELRTRFPKIQIIAHTGHGSADFIHRSITAGFKDHLVKPADPVKLNGKVHEACEQRHDQHCASD